MSAPSHMNSSLSRLTKKALEELVIKLREEITAGNEERQAMSTELVTAREKIQTLEVDLNTALAQVQTAEAALEQAQIAAATAQAGRQAAAGHGHAEHDLMPRPSGVVRNLQELTGMSYETYKACQRTVRNIVVMAGLDVTEDFRRQNVDDLAKVYRAAREQHPVLRQYQNNWVTAEMAKQFLQNRRKHAVRRGYISRAVLKTGPRGRRVTRARSESVEI